MEVVISEAISREDLGVFASSFLLTNYEYTLKTDPKSRETSDESQAKEADHDERCAKYTKHISTVVISTKDCANVIQDPKYALWVASARGTEYSRDVANTRASVATPDFMEE